MFDKDNPFSKTMTVWFSVKVMYFYLLLLFFLLFPSNVFTRLYRKWVKQIRGLDTKLKTIIVLCFCVSNAFWFLVQRSLFGIFTVGEILFVLFGCLAFVSKKLKGLILHFFTGGALQRILLVTTAILVAFSSMMLMLDALVKLNFFARLKGTEVASFNVIFWLLGKIFGTTSVVVEDTMGKIFYVAGFSDYPTFVERFSWEGEVGVITDANRDSIAKVYHQTQMYFYVSLACLAFACVNYLIIIQLRLSRNRRWRLKAMIAKLRKSEREKLTNAAEGGNKGFNIEQLPDDWKAYFAKIGIERELLEDPESAKIILDKVKEFERKLEEDSDYESDSDDEDDFIPPPPAEEIVLEKIKPIVIRRLPKSKRDEPKPSGGKPSEKELVNALKGLKKVERDDPKKKDQVQSSFAGAHGFSQADLMAQIKKLKKFKLVKRGGNRKNFNPTKDLTSNGKVHFSVLLKSSLEQRRGRMMIKQAQREHDEKSQKTPDESDW